MSGPRERRSAARPARRDRNGHAAVPVLLPRVVFQIAADGTMTVALNGAQCNPAPSAPPWRREDFGRILDQLAEQPSSPVRVEVREADGAVFTDIITPSTHRRPPGDPGPEAPPPTIPVLLAVRGDGFAPGEDVAIAVIVAHVDAGPDGTARGLLAAERIAASPTREVVLFGQVSGTVTVWRPE